MSDLISRADAIEAVRKKLQDWGSYAFEDYRRGLYEAQDIIEALPSAEQTDCTDFIKWLVDRVLDETIWEYNSVAYGEIICRKLEKLGVLEVTEEPSYYIRHIKNNTMPSDLVYRPSADAEQVTGKLKKPCDSLLTEDSKERKEQKSKLESADAEWIPCSERLPKVGENVLFTTDIYGGYVAEGDRRADGKWWQYRWNSLLQNEEVTAWMPLPKPYKGGGDE